MFCVIRGDEVYKEVIKVVVDFKYFLLYIIIWFGIIYNDIVKYKRW